MFNACGLDPGAFRLRSLPIRAVCAPRASRSFAITVRVSRGRHARLAPSPGRLSEFRDTKLPAIENSELEDNELQTLPSSQSIERDVHQEIEADPGNEVANNDQNELKEQRSGRRERRYSELDLKILEPQEFHSQINPTLLQNIMRKIPLLRGMPVCDSTFNAVRSGRNLFIMAPGPGRSLQYLLPVVHSILKRIWRRKPGPPMPPHQRPVHPSEVLIICPTPDDAKTVEFMGARLLKDSGARLKMVVLDRPMSIKSVDFRYKGYSILISTPEILLQWLALGHSKETLLEMLQDVKTLVIDGKARFLSDIDFLETLGGVMEDIPLSREAQRVVISDKHDEKLAERLARVALLGDYEFHHEPRLEEVQALREARESEIKDKKRRKKREYVRKNKALNPLLFDT